MCGGCGGGAPRTQNVRKQVVNASSVPTKKAITKFVPRTSVRGNKIEIQRQYSIPRQTCPKCSYPAMTVNIANRERYQCSNSNCRYILR